MTNSCSRTGVPRITSTYAVSSSRDERSAVDAARSRCSIPHATASAIDEARQDQRDQRGAQQRRQVRAASPADRRGARRWLAPRRAGAVAVPPPSRA